MVILILDRLKVMQSSIILDFRIFFYNEFPFPNVIKNILLSFLSIDECCV